MIAIKVGIATINAEINVTNKTFVTWAEIQKLSEEICRQVSLDGWRPDYIVGITRGGLVPSVIISHWLKCDLHTLKVQFRDGVDGNKEHNLWMADDAFEGKKILIVDDIKDTSATIDWIKEDWMSSHLPNDPRWDDVWGNNVRVAILYDKVFRESKIPVSYSGVEITLDTADKMGWIVFPWEKS